MKLYEITNELAAILGDEEEGFPDDVADRLTKLEMELHDKVDGVLAYRQGIVRQADGFLHEAARMKAKADALTRKAEWLKDYVLSCMVGCGVDRSMGNFTASVAKSPPKVEFEGEDIPVKYRAVIPESHTLDKKKVISDIRT